MTIQRERIVAAALRLLNQNGAEGVTMRALAKDLKIQAPSLYWHFSSKQALLDAMADAMVAQVGWDFDPGDDWTVTLSKFAHRMRAALLAHRDGARVFAGTFPVTDNILKVGDAVIGAVHAAGTSLRDAAWAMFSINYYVIGFVLEEQAVQHGADDAGPTLSAIGKEVGSHAGDHPVASAALLELIAEDADSRFRFGLETIIAGLASRMSAIKPVHRRR